MSQAEEDPFPPRDVDLEHPNVARIYDFLLGGKANWAIDRAFCEQAMIRIPVMRSLAVANRVFLHRTVRHLVKRGVRQFIDIGSGVPTMGNTHVVADEVASGSKVIYIDNEPVAVAHSQVLLESENTAERHAVINADFRSPDRLWQRVIETGRLDLEQPVAVLLIAVLHVQQAGPDGVDMSPQAIARYRELLPPGGYLAISHVSDEGVPPKMAKGLINVKNMYDRSSSPVIWRSRQEILNLFGDFELIEPGLTWTPEWHPEETGPNSPEIQFDTPSESVILAGVGQKP